MKKFLGILGMLLLTACGAGTNTSKTESVIDADAARWPNPRLIPICFTNKSAVDLEIYNDLLNTAVTQFRNAGVYFQKWRECTSDDYNQRIIRVKFKDVYDWTRSGSYTYGGGLSKVGMTRSSLSNEGGATMWIKLDNSYPSAEGRKRDNIVAGTRSAFLHEIGHALGLLHEHTRTDYKPDGGECEAGADQANVPETTNRDYIGKPDYDSVMSYCNLTIQKLSAGDIRGIHALYPELND